jgi:N-acyl amino acid synthase of PEP-CTERM/exosortase system
MMQAKRLRYQVYVEECRFLSPADHPLGQESDEFDTWSAHFCAFNRPRELVGYCRLVRANDQSRFPFEDHCQVALDERDRPPLTATAEISRMIVRSDYRRRRGDTIVGVTVTQGGADGAPQVGERRTNSPQILLSLFRQMYLYSTSHGIEYWYAAMERHVARALARIGAFTFREIGPEIDYFGPVVPLLARLTDIESSVRSRDPAMLAWLQRRDEPALEC